MSAFGAGGARLHVHRVREARAGLSRQAHATGPRREALVQ